ncbi:tetratricopeptide repeat protein [Limisphaera sp. VF-2]|uniref:tetratricopeptide repeat protein n=1 Tax=Limisphaera sp. VF-2 TaxID=3400418 RepID=UPI003C1E3896
MTIPFFRPNIDKLAAQRNVPRLLHIVRTASLEDRIKALEAIGSIGDPCAIQQAVESLSDKSLSPAWDSAIRILRRLPRPDAAKVCAQIVTSDVEPELQEKVLSAALQGEALWDVEEWVRIGTILAEKQRSALAAACFDQALAVLGSNKTLLRSIAFTLYDKSLPEYALRFFKRIAEIDPDDAGGWGGQSKCLLTLGRLKEAEHACRKALEIAPSYRPFKECLATIYYEMQEFKRMASLARELLREDPSDVKAHVMLSEALIFAGELADAEAQVQEGLAKLMTASSADPAALSILYLQLGILRVMKGHEGAGECF